jgi:hypothetical protein
MSALASALFGLDVLRARMLPVENLDMIEGPSDSRGIERPEDHQSDTGLIPN